jgi:hypothetical protein
LTRAVTAHLLIQELLLRRHLLELLRGDLLTQCRRLCRLLLLLLLLLHSQSAHKRGTGGRRRGNGGKRGCLLLLLELLLMLQVRLDTPTSERYGKRGSKQCEQNSASDWSCLLLLIQELLLRRHLLELLRGDLWHLLRRLCRLLLLLLLLRLHSQGSSCMLGLKRLQESTHRKVEDSGV